MPASTIAEIITALDGVIDKARKDKSRLGYFPALYRKVTIAVQEGIRAGEFERRRADGKTGRDLCEPVPGCPCRAS